MHKLRSTLLFTMPAVALAVGSASTAFAGGPGGHFRALEVYVRADGSMAKVNGDNGTNANPDGCGDSGFYVVERATVGDDAFQRVVTQLTEALLANKRVSIWLDGCSRGHYWGHTRPVIYDVRVFRD